MSVTDDGVGLPPATEKHKGMGLHTMSYRANLINASLSIKRGVRRLALTIVKCSSKSKIVDREAYKLLPSIGLRIRPSTQKKGFPRRVQLGSDAFEVAAQ
jgi:hypothetical protein